LERSEAADAHDSSATTSHSNLSELDGYFSAFEGEAEVDLSVGGPNLLNGDRRDDRVVVHRVFETLAGDRRFAVVQSTEFSVSERQVTTVRTFRLGIAIGRQSLRFDQGHYGCSAKEQAEKQA